jgi:hypothetical protein
MTQKTKKEAKLLLLAIALLTPIIIYSLTTQALLTPMPRSYIELNITLPTKLIENGKATYLFELKFTNGTGKNLIQFPFNPNIKASQLLALIKYADAISYFDQSRNKTIGYITAFGGIGKNFIIEANKTYEISVTKPLNWTYSQ